MARSAEDISNADLRLILAKGIGPAIRRRLLERFGSVEAIVEAPAIAFESIQGIGEQTAQAIRSALDEADPDGERDLMLAHDVSLILHGDRDYPPLLAAIPDPPVALWIRGEMAAEDQLAIAMVGARRCTAYGREQSARFAALLAQSGLTIVSGGAYGIDGEAHRAALRVNGRTIVVQGCGLARTYPQEHEDLFERVVAERHGALISEHPMNAPPLAKNFPKRNRIISGLSLGVLVIEAAMRSGALITARLAADEHGREVMALPGRVDSPASAGCLKILRDGEAGMVLSHADVIQQLDGVAHLMRGAAELADEGRSPAKSAMHFDLKLSHAQQAIVDILRESQDVLLVDQLAARTQIPMSQLLSELTLLQIRGHIQKDHRGVRLRQRN